MGITALDIKIRKSQRITDFPDGGGRMVAAEVVDGQLNNLFNDISTQDRVAGRVSMRKGFVHIDTTDTTPLLGAVGVVVEPPEDDDVFITMFSTGSYADVRADARNRIESYITRGVESRYVLFGDHFVGQRSVIVYCLKDAPTPEVNQTFALSVENQGYAPVAQYIRVQEVASRTTQVMYDDSGAFERDVIVMNTTTSLLYDFPGQEASRFTSTKPPTRVRLTNVSDASSYYGIKRLQLAAAIGDLVVKVDSPYTPLVPATQAETPVTDVLAGLGALAMVQAGVANALTLSYSASFPAGVPVACYLGSPFTRGGVTVSVSGTTLTDDGTGNLAAEGGASPWSGSVDYVAGQVVLAHASGASGSVSITATAAGPVLQQGHSAAISVTALNRGISYVFQLKPLPAPGTVFLDFRALGKWIRLSDNGTGQLRGAPGQGSGTINYATGSLSVTLGALPDLDSDLIASFGTAVQTQRRNGDTAIKPPALSFFLPHTGIKPGTVGVGWLVNASPVTATDDGKGVLKIGTTPVGTIVYATGRIELRPTTLPDANSQITTSYTHSPQEQSVFTPALSSGVASIDLGGPVRPGGTRLQWAAQILEGEPGVSLTTRLVALIAKDDGAGNLVGVSIDGAAWAGSVGTINTASGIASVQMSGLTVQVLAVPTYSMDQGGDLHLENYIYLNNTAICASGTPITVQWQDADTTDTAATSAIALPPVTLDLTPTVIDSVVSASVRFQFRGRTYVDLNGSLYMDISSTSGSGTYAGTIDYASGIATISNWAPGGSNAVTVDALLTRFTMAGVSRMNFRTPGAPLRPSSLTLRVNTVDGELLTATSDNNGVITGDRIAGAIDWVSGSASVRFGEMVPAAGNESEPWFAPDNVVGGQIWRPLAVMPDTAYIGVVVYRTIPANPDLLGLDPVRLPEDGRVVIFRPGQTVLVHHTATHSIASPAPDQVVNFGRPNVSRVEVRDSLAAPVDSIWYVIDRAAGTLTFANTLNLSAYTLPIVITERVEDRSQVADAQITGEIALNKALRHDYPLGACLSTCLILGEMNGSPDLQARVVNVFDQATWTQEFSDVRIGNGVDAQYNDVTYPIVVDNANAITERWAIHFTNATNFELIGETVGIIATGSTATDFSPPNPRTGQPYMTILAAGWGAGWSSNNVLRLNTIGGLAPVWFLRTTLAGEMEVSADGFRFLVLGDAAP